MGRGRYGEFIKTKLWSRICNGYEISRSRSIQTIAQESHFAYMGHIVERRRKVLGVRKTISIL